MKVPDEVRKTVGFIAYEDARNGNVIPVGTFFFLGHDAKQGSQTSDKVYAVTARHVIAELQKKGRDDLTLRLNPKRNGDPLITITVKLADWYIHPSDTSIDVAIFEMGIPAEADHLTIPFSMCATDSTFDQHEVALGDEIFISGLFRHHFGKSKNIPIVRTGNLAALSEERVETKSFGKIDAFLIEARSIGGLSGSPVFLNLGVARLIGGELRFGTGPIFFLLGLIHGHFDTSTGNVDAANEDASTDEKVNAGIAIVVPIEKVRLVIRAYESEGDD